MAAPQPRARALTVHHHLRRHLVLVVFTVAAAATCTRAAASAHTTAAASPAPRAAKSESASPAAASYLRARCNTTLYPSLCYDSLLPYASEVQDNPARLARVAADVAAERLRALSARVKEILRHGGGGAEPGEGGAGGRPSETDALRDCASTVSAAASLAKQSSAELTKLEPDAAAGTSATSSASAAAGDGMSGSRQARWEVSNAKTWLSAAMANEGTCADGLVEAGATASPAGGKEVTTGVATVKQYTSNALALVNGIPA